MFFPVVDDSGVAPFRQIAEQIRHAVMVGALADGEQLPSLGRLAAVFGVTPATVQQALKVVKAEGLVTGRTGRGTFAHAPASRPVPVGDRVARYLAGAGAGAVVDVYDLDPAVWGPLLGGAAPGARLRLLNAGEPCDAPTPWAAQARHHARGGWPFLRLGTGEAFTDLADGRLDPAQVLHVRPLPVEPDALGAWFVRTWDALA